MGGCGKRSLAIEMLAFSHCCDLRFEQFASTVNTSSTFLNIKSLKGTCSRPAFEFDRFSALAQETGIIPNISLARLDILLCPYPPRGSTFKFAPI